ncbi:PepSY domain-containing protein [Candidatus Pacearchaeota archaeon]|nr:PepSY domain-containing protein [Candidatus Pacearchaeota archaeon]
MKTSKIIYLTIALLIVVVIDMLFLFWYANNPYQNNKEKFLNEKINEIYNPVINPQQFSSHITNQYFSLTPGKKMIYESKTEEGLEKIEVYIMNETKTVNGVETRVVWDRVWLNDELIEDTKDWYAQDNEGNVWYFGEESKEIIDGIIVSTKGSWEAGINGAKPGVIMKAAPNIGDKYRQEYYKGEAEDWGEVLAINENVRVSYREFTNCIKTRDYTPLEPNVNEHKYYCPEVGGVVLEEEVNGEEKAELIKVEYNTLPSLSQEKKQELLKTKITEEQAKEIALKEVNGRVTDISIEKKFSKTAYVVEINNGDETDVIIDLNTGEVLGIER